MARLKKAPATKAPVRLRTRTTRSGSKSLYLDIYHKGRRTYEFLGLYLVPVLSPPDKYQNDQTMRVAEAIRARRVVELQAGRHGLTAPHKAGGGLYRYMERFAKGYEARGQLSAYKNYTDVVKQLRRYHESDPPLSSVGTSFVVGFVHFMSKAQSRNGRPYAPNTQKKSFDMLSTALNEAVRENIILQNPCMKLSKSDRPKNIEVTKEYLTLSDIGALAAARCSNEHVKRAFLFACFCGLRLSDVCALTWDKVKNLSGGAKQVEVRMKKTRAPIYLPLSDNALQWLPPRGNDKGGRVFDIPTNYGVNKCLKRWAAVAGIAKHVTFHVSRHTFATLLLSYGTDIYTASKLLGHTDIKTTQVYAKIVDEAKRAAVDSIPLLHIPAPPSGGIELARVPDMIALAFT